MTNPLVAMPSSPTDTSLDRPWPRFDEARWPATRDHLHLLSQMLGKLRVAIAPPLPEWFHASLAVTPRGLTTRLLPHPSGALEASIDLVDGVIRLSAAGGRVETVAVVPARSIAAIWTDLLATLDELGFGVDLWDKPQERADVTPFALDDRIRDYDPALGASWLAMITDVHALFEAWRSPFFGRSGVNFWWGGFDITVALYNGRHAIPRPGANYVMRYDLDAEHLTIGFWPGDDRNDPMFFSYLVPEPANCPTYPMDVPSSGWAPTKAEWILPYEAVRDRPNRLDVVRRFMDAGYRAAGDLAGWDLASLTYVVPGAAPRDGPQG
jgi:uncharacterized protein DUF5996